MHRRPSSPLTSSMRTYHSNNGPLPQFPSHPKPIGGGSGSSSRPGLGLGLGLSNNLNDDVWSFVGESKSLKHEREEDSSLILKITACISTYPD
ncbi:hypothetical protein ACE6H2_008748 [Prunus campanulata]